ncbi:MAG: DUF87 domain-containing protein [bacterium]
MAENKDITYFGETDFRGKKVPFGIKSKDRTRHMYVIGKTGMGKSTLLENLAVQDIKNGNGLAFIDPHGKSAELLLKYIPKERIKDVIYFTPHDTDFPVSFNVMEDVGKDQRHLVANGLMASFKKIWPDVWSARMEYISMNLILALLEYPGSTLLGINRMLSDKDFRKKVVDNVTDPSVKAFWVNEFAKYSEKIMVEAGASIQNKFGQFSSNPLIRNIIGQSKSSFNVRDLMDSKKIFIANLSKGRMGEINCNLIGGMLITKMYLGAMSRANASESELDKLPNSYLYVDEFQSFVNDSFADILSEARKYKLNLIIAHQYIEQMPETVRNAVFGNVGTTISFRVGPFDAEVLEKVFAPKFTAEDIVNLGMYQMYLSLMINGVGSTPFSAKGMAPIAQPEVKVVDEVIAYSRATYAKPRDVVEEEIRKWHEAPIVEGKIYDKVAVKKELDVIKKDYGIKEFPAKKTFPSSNNNGTFNKNEKKEFTPNASQQKIAPVPNMSYKTSTPPQVVAPTPKPVSNLQKTLEKTVGQVIDSSIKNNKPFVINITSSTQEKVSLSSLNKAPQEDKKSTGKNMADFKSVLSQVMESKDKSFSLGKIDAKKDTSAPEDREVVIEDKEIETQKKPISTNPVIDKKVDGTEVVKEVPEHVLRKIIDNKESEDKKGNDSLTKIN